MKKVSVIIPVYNDEKYIKRSITSVLEQTYKNIEIILVDDGSKDASGDICNDYADRYENIYAYHMENGGASSARNLALNKSTGDHITFLDGDDWLDRDFIYMLVDEMESHGADICVGNYRRVYADEKASAPYKPFHTTLDCNDAFIEIMKKEHCAWELCSKLYRRELFDDFSFDEDIQICEDLLSNWYLFRKAVLVRFCGVCGYNYLYRTDSITKEGDIRNKTEYLVFDRIYNESFECEEDAGRQIRQLCTHEELSYTDDALHKIDIWGEEYFEKVACFARRMVDKQYGGGIPVGYEYLNYPVNDIAEIYKGYRDRFINDMRTYVNSHVRNYIYGHGQMALKAAKYLKKNGIHFDGYMVTERSGYETDDVISYDCERIKSDHTGIITGLGKKALSEVRKLFSENDISDVMTVDWNVWWLR